MGDKPKDKPKKEGDHGRAKEKQELNDKELDAVSGGYVTKKARMGRNPKIPTK